VFLLGLLAVAVSAFVGARLELARRMADRLRVDYVARAGVERSKGVLQLETNEWDALNERWANSPRDFRDVACGDGSYSVYYSFQKADGSSGTNYGVRDEQARIDIRARRTEVLTALLRTAGGMSSEEALRLVQNLRTATTPPGTDLRPGDAGWISPDITNGPLLSTYDLLWIKGMSRAVYERIREHITVHGGERININTAGPAVLRAILQWKGPDESGTTERLVSKILNFRESGGIFSDYRNLGGAFSGQTLLTQDEAAQLNAIAPFVTVRSEHFRGYVTGGLRGRASANKVIEFVWNPKLKAIEYWHED
jgi:type II secretory pathway component PulK